MLLRAYRQSIENLPFSVELYDFHLRAGKSEGLPRQFRSLSHTQSAFTDVIDWVVAYFKASVEPLAAAQVDGHHTSIITTKRMPLILQHQGHSRTIIGYVRFADGRTELLVFDPSWYVPRLSYSFAHAVTNSSSIPNRKLRAAGIATLPADIRAQMPSRDSKKCLYHRLLQAKSKRHSETEG